jgi:hypothetical protein
MNPIVIERYAKHLGRMRTRLWVAVWLVTAGLLVQSCSDNSGPAGPAFQNGQTVPVTGTAPTNAQIVVQVVVNPSSTEPGRRVNATAIVTDFNGLPLAGRRVTIFAIGGGTAGGTVDNPVGITDANGTYTTTVIVRCADTGIVGPPATTNGTVVKTVVISAIVEGKVAVVTATVTLTPSGDNPPCPGSA